MPLITLDWSFAYLRYTRSTPCLRSSISLKLLMKRSRSSSLAISVLSCEAGTSSLRCLARTALRIAVRKSAIGSETAMRFSSVPASRRTRCPPAAWSSRAPQQAPARRLRGDVSPARFDDARNLTGQRQLTEADAAQPEVAQEAARTPAAMAAGVRPDLELRSPFPLFDDGLLRHRSSMGGAWPPSYCVASVARRYGVSSDTPP